MSNIAVLNGHVISDLFRNTISTTVMILAGLVLGFRSSASFFGLVGNSRNLSTFTLAFSLVNGNNGRFSKKC